MGVGNDSAGQPIIARSSDSRTSDFFDAREPLDPSTVGARLAAAGRRDAFVVGQVLRTGSTNADLAAAPPGDGTAIAVLTTEEQVAGRGRAGRGWACPPGAGLMFSLRLRTDVDLRGIGIDRYGWAGAVLGLAIRAALADRIDIGLKWPNDLQVDDRKLGGILAEFTGAAVIVGAGVNISLRSDELPRADATSLALEGVPVDRADVLGRVLVELDALLAIWRADQEQIRTRYRQACVTLGRQVRVELPGGKVIAATAVDVSPDGALRVDTGGTVRDFGAGDVVHLRAADSPPAAD